MSKRTEDPLVAEIRYELMPGRFVKWDEVSRLVHNLARVHEKVEALVKAGEVERAVRLYEVFLSGVYAKVEEADDECDLANLFHRLICGWIQARQAAGQPAEETVRQLLNWMKNDDYGFCHGIEGEVVKVLDPPGRQLFIRHFQQLVDDGLPRQVVGSGKAIFEYENSLRLPAMSLREIHEALGDVPAYAALCERLGLSPRECEHLAEMEVSRQHWAKALEWVEKGMALKPRRNWHNEDAYGLDRLKPEILRHLGRKEDALALAWGEFEASPNEFAYEQLMRYIPRAEKTAWQDRAMAAAEKADLGEWISLCVKAKEWERLARRVHSAKGEQLESLSHYCTEPAAQGLAKRDALAAAKLHRALGLRIVNAGKSKYYREALRHFENARDRYSASGHSAEWQSLVGTVRVAHSRKSSFLSAFERIVSGKPHSSSCAEEAQVRWKRLTS
ncbi:MAG: DUF6880 family protein [Limisphaerales bacterium]